MRLTRWKFDVVEEEVVAGGQDVVGVGVGVEIATAIVAIAGVNATGRARALERCNIQRLWLWLER